MAIGELQIKLVGMVLFYSLRTIFKLKTMTKIPRVKEKNVRIREIQKAAKEIFFNKGFANTTNHKEKGVDQNV